MRIERARPDILGFGRFSSREFLGLSLVRKRFGRPCVRSFSRSQFKRDVPRAFGLASHDETLSPLRRRLAVGDKPKLLRILHIAQRDLQDLNRRRPDSFRAASDPDHPPALRIRFPRWPLGQKVSREGRLRPQLGGSWGRSLEVPVREAGTISNVVSQSAETIKFYFRIQEWPVLNLRVA